jgi:hypothetical protein
VNSPHVSYSEPVSVAEGSEASTVFGRSNVEIPGSNPSRGMDVCLRFSVLCCPVCRYRPCFGPITRPRSPTNCLIDS